MEFFVQVTSISLWWPLGTVLRFYVTTRKTALTRFVYCGPIAKHAIQTDFNMTDQGMLVYRCRNSISISLCKLFLCCGLLCCVLNLCHVHGGDWFYRWCHTETPNSLICLKTTLMERAKCGWLCVSTPKGTSLMRQ